MPWRYGGWIGSAVPSPIWSTPSTAAGRLQFNIIAAFAQFERDLINERVRAGLNAARAGPAG